MSTPAIFTFKSDAPQTRPDIHLVHHSDGYPKSASTHLIPGLADVAVRLWKGDQLDLEHLNLTVDNAHGRYTIDGVQRRGSLGELVRGTAFYYEIQMRGDRPSTVKVFRHETIGAEGIQERVEAAREALRLVEREMTEAASAPTYVEIGSGTLSRIRHLGFESPPKSNEVVNLAAKADTAER